MDKTLVLLLVLAGTLLISTASFLGWFAYQRQTAEYAGPATVERLCERGSDGKIYLFSGRFVVGQSHFEEFGSIDIDFATPSARTVAAVRLWVTSKNQPNKMLKLPNRFDGSDIRFVTNSGTITTGADSLSTIGEAFLFSSGGRFVSPIVDVLGWASPVLGGCRVYVRAFDLEGQLQPPKIGERAAFNYHNTEHE